MLVAWAGRAAGYATRATPVILGPGLEGQGPGGSILDSWNLVAAEQEEVVDHVVGGQEALRLPG